MREKGTSKLKVLLQDLERNLWYYRQSMIDDEFSAQFCLDDYVLPLFEEIVRRLDGGGEDESKEKPLYKEE